MRINAAHGHRLSFHKGEMPIPKLSAAGGACGAVDWLSAERWCARLKWRAVSFQDAIEGKCDGVSSMLEVK